MTGRVLVTGGSGFIGSHVAEAYLEEGWDVTVVDDLTSGRPSNVPEGAEFHLMDIRDDTLDRLFRIRDFDLVNHHAAQIDVRVSVDRPRHDASVNVDGLLNVLECARRHGTGRVVFASSGGVVYGEPEEIPAPEDAEKRPLSPYGVTKLAGEHYLYFYARVHGISGVSLRYSNVYGPRQDPHGEAGVVAIFARRLLNRNPLTIYGDGEQTRDYVYVKDVARANMLASEMDLDAPGAPDGSAFNVGTGRETSVNQLADAMMEVTDVEVERSYAPERPGELERNALDAGRLEERGWKPRWDLHEGLRSTVEAIRAGEEL